jgi:7-cyano-7-deazaguanine synthase in queuosine biosynthesis
MSYFTPPQETEVIYVLWTGGLDSSYRVIQLSRLPIQIQPIYVSDNQRKSVEYELRAIAGITEDIQAHPSTKCNILPLKIIEKDSIEGNAGITDAYQRLNCLSPIGSQYEWLARLASYIPKLEMSLERSATSKALNCIQKLGSVNKITIDGSMDYYIVDRKSHHDLLTIFGNFRFPASVFEKTKIEEMNEMIGLGFKTSFERTVFCQQPINDEPCGFCGPCRSVIAEGMNFRITNKGMRRYDRAVRMDVITQFLSNLHVPSGFRRIGGKVYNRIRRLLIRVA